MSFKGYVGSVSRFSNTSNGLCVAQRKSGSGQELRFIINTRPSSLSSLSLSPKNYGNLNSSIPQQSLYHLD
jgi:hypothetical protein